jgi:hypothetical protein
MKNFTLNLTTEDLEIIVKSLSTQPYSIVVGVINKIQKQYNECIKNSDNGTDVELE